MIELMTQEQIIDTEYDRYRLSYHIHEIKEDELNYYGVSIFQYKGTQEKGKVFDKAIIKGFSESLQETIAFFQILVKEIVFPVHLLSIADDWCNLKMS